MVSHRTTTAPGLEAVAVGSEGYPTALDRVPLTPIARQASDRYGDDVSRGCSWHESPIEAMD